MASKSDFTPEEWKTIVAAAPMVGLAVTCASPNGPWGVMKEMLSMGMAMAEMLEKGSSNTDEFKKWLLTVGRRVAEAANEGGIFGFGGERVSDAEKNVLRQIAFALGQPAING